MIVPMTVCLNRVGYYESFNSGCNIYLLTGKGMKPEYSAAFPAQSITTPLEWTDLALSISVMDQINEILAWISHGPTLMQDWNLEKIIKPRYRVLFYGASGTGKTLVATLLAKSTGCDIYRVDLAMIVSNYIGETEKNLSRIFDIAANRDWILFFDEADALFGKRTVATTSNDRHANQQNSYLLQRIESFPGIVILASNLEGNMDEAFTRRFQSTIHLTMPNAEERYLLWQRAFSDVCTLEDDINLHEIAEKYEINGGSIINVLRYCAVSAIARGSERVNEEELLAGIRREYKKENWTL